MNDMYGSDVTVGQMLGVYLEQREAARKSMKVIQIPTLPQIRSLFNFGGLIHKEA